MFTDIYIRSKYLCFQVGIWYYFFFPETAELNKKRDSPLKVGSLLEISQTGLSCLSVCLSSCVSANNLVIIVWVRLSVMCDILYQLVVLHHTSTGLQCLFSAVFCLNKSVPRNNSTQKVSSTFRQKGRG